MTERLYYTEARCRRFAATVVSCEPAGASFRIVLDRTAFYPTSGGQPFDTGRLDDVEITDVVDEEEAVVHVGQRPLAAGLAVEGEIDWARRFDHMQQHTGQHVLSAAFERASGLATVSFHMGDLVSTIDLAREAAPADLEAAERLANEVVFECRPIVVRQVSHEEAAGLPLRKATSRTGAVRVVEVPDFDLSACGGTHVDNTGAVGAIVVAGAERFKGGSRVTFACGFRAVAAHGRLRDVAQAAGRRLSVGLDGIGPQIDRLQQDLRAREKRIEELSAEVVSARAAELGRQTETIGPFSGVLRQDESADMAMVKALAVAVVGRTPGVVAILVGGGDPTPVVATRSPGVAFDAQAFVRALTAACGGRGGGRAELAQAGVPGGGARVLAIARQLLA